MDEQPDIVAALRTLERSLDGAEVSPTADARIRARVLGGAEEKSWAWHVHAGVALASFAAGALFIWVVQGSTFAGSQAEQGSSGSIAEAGFVPGASDCSPQHTGGQLLLTGQCVVSLEHPRATLSTLGATRLRKHESGVQLFDGTATFDVAPVPSARPPFRVLVSAGAIEVVGTRFTVAQDPDGSGYVDLFEGSIRFVPNQGEAAWVRVGQRYVWTQIERSTTSAPAGEDASASARQRTAGRMRELHPRSSLSEPVEETPSGDRTSIDDGPAAEVIERVYQLRARRQYEEAVRLLTVTLSKRGLSDAAGEVLSLELGTLVTNFLGDPQAACGHWSEHRKRFQAGRFGSEVQQVMAELDCPK